MNGLIIAGGKAKRLQGLPKGLLRINEHTIIEHIIHELHTCCSKILIITNGTDYDYLKTPQIEIFPDTIKDIGPMGGLYTGLMKTNTLKNITVSCDLPFITSEVFKQLMLCPAKADIIISKIKNDIHPLCGIYSKSVLPVIEHQITKKDFKLKNLLQQTNTHFLEFPQEYARCFTNINTIKDIQHIQNQKTNGHYSS